MIPVRPWQCMDDLVGPRHSLVAAAHDTNSAGKFTGKGVPVPYFSDDGGRTWRAGKLLFEVGSLTK